MTKSIPLSRAVTLVTVAIAACLLAFANPVSALAATGQTTNPENEVLHQTTTTGASHTSGGGASLVRTIVGLAIVIAVIWGLSWILRQVKAGRNPQVSSDGLASVSALTLGSGRSVHLVRTGNEYVLLGSAEHGVVPIHRYTEQQAREAGLLSEQEPARPRRFIRERQTPAGPAAARPVAPGQGLSDPMSMPSTSSSVIARLREMTVRR
jgi:flagellar protein FliO/FliZ